MGHIQAKLISMYTLIKRVKSLFLWKDSYMLGCSLDLDQDHYGERKTSSRRWNKYLGF